MKQVGLSFVGAAVLMTVSPSRGVAEAEPQQALSAQHHQSSYDWRNKSGALVKAVREATERFKDVAVAEGEGYKLMFGCVSGPDSGAMGLHYVKMPYVLDGELDPSRPEIIIYEPVGNGRVRMTGADFLIFAADWHKNYPPQETPQLGGQLLHLFESPNRFGLPPFYTLHVWAWKENPTGMFVNWHSKVSCESFTPENSRPVRGRADGARPPRPSVRPSGKPLDGGRYAAYHSAICGCASPAPSRSQPVRRVCWWPAGLR